MEQSEEWLAGHRYLTISGVEEKTVQKQKEEVVLQPVTL